MYTYVYICICTCIHILVFGLSRCFFVPLVSDVSRSRWRHVVKFMLLY